jgi:hypothetical protein
VYAWAGAGDADGDAVGDGDAGPGDADGAVEAGEIGADGICAPAVPAISAIPNDIARIRIIADALLRLRRLRPVASEAMP